MEILTTTEFTLEHFERRIDQLQNEIQHTHYMRIDKIQWLMSELKKAQNDYQKLLKK